jgi:hypothetical protein
LSRKSGVAVLTAKEKVFHIQTRDKQPEDFEDLPERNYSTDY